MYAIYISVCKVYFMCCTVTFTSMPQPQHQNLHTAVLISKLIKKSRLKISFLLFSEENDFVSFNLFFLIKG